MNRSHQQELSLQGVSRRKGYEYDYSRALQMITLNQQPPKKQPQILDESRVRAQTHQPFDSLKNKISALRKASVTSRPSFDFNSVSIQREDQQQQPLVPSPNLQQTLEMQSQKSGFGLGKQMLYPVRVGMQLVLAYLIFSSFILIQRQLANSKSPLGIPLYEQVLYLIVWSVSLSGQLSRQSFSYVLICMMSSIPLLYFKFSAIWVLLVLMSACGLGAILFDLKHTKLLIPILLLALYFIYIYQVLPALYSSLTKSNPLAGKYVFIGIFPILNYLAEIVYQILLNLQKEPYLVTSNLESGMLGLSVGMILANPLNSPQFWYLLFFLSISKFVGMIGVFRKAILESIPIVIPFFPRHKNSRIIEQLHFIAVLYIVIYFQLLVFPYENQSIYAHFWGNSWYQPLVVWALFSIYVWLSLKNQLRKVQSRREIRFLECLDESRWICISYVQRVAARLCGIWQFYIGVLAPLFLIKFQ